VPTFLSARGQRIRIAAASLFVAPALMIACGGDDNGDGGGGGGTATDEEYMAAMCDSFNTFTEDLLGQVFAAAATAGANEAAQEEAVTEAAQDVFGALLDDLRDMGVPSDVREYHDQMTDQMAQALDAIEEGGLEALDEELNEEIEMPQDIQDRLTGVAEDLPECEGVDVF
jgi:hypothetical protein